MAEVVPDTNESYIAQAAIAWEIAKQAVFHHDIEAKDAVEHARKLGEVYQTAFMLVVNARAK